MDERFVKHRGRASAAEGRKTRVELQRDIEDNVEIRAIYTLGFQDRDVSHKEFHLFLRKLLQGKSSIDDPRYEMLRKFYFPIKDRGPGVANVMGPMFEPVSMTLKGLNDSQKAVVEALGTSHSPFITVQGKHIKHFTVELLSVMSRPAG